MRSGFPLRWRSLSCAVILALAVSGLSAQTALQGTPAIEVANAVVAQEADADPDAPAAPEAAGAEEGQPMYETSDDVSNWLEAGSAEELGSRVRTSAVLLAPDGMLHCSLFRLDHVTRQEISVKQMEIKLIQDGKDIETTEPNPEDGKFQFGPVKPGIYSIIGYGEDGFAAFSFAVDQAPDEDSMEADEASAEKKEKQPGDEYQSLNLIHSSALDPQDVPMALQLIRAFVGVGGGGPGAEIEDEAAMEELAVEETEPAAVKPFRKIARDAKIAQSISLHWHTVRLQPDGLLIGRIMTLVEMNESGEVQAVPPEDMQVFAIKDGTVAARATCSEKGNFAIPDLKPEIYSFLGVGRDGFVALTIDVLPAEEKDEMEGEGKVKSASFRRTAFIQNQNQNLNQLNIFTHIVPPNGVNFLETSNPDTQQNVLGQNTDLPASFLGANSQNGNGNNPSSGNSSGIAPISSPSGPSGNPGGFGGAGAGGGTTGGDGGTNTGVPEIDPASSGVGLSILIGLLFLLVDLYRPR